MDLSPVSRESLRLPAPLRLRAGSLIIALLLNLLPWSGTASQINPDFVLLVLLYWAAHEPRSVGQGLGFILGLVMDVADSVLLGQHALIYVVAIFLAQLFRVRIARLNLPAQALHIGAILILVQVISVSLNLSLGREVPVTFMAIAPVVGAIMWPAICAVLALPRLRNRSSQNIG